MSRFGGLVPFLLAPSAKIRQQLLGHMAFLERFVPWGRARMQPLNWQLKMSWSAALDDPVKLVPLLEGCKEYIGRRLREER